MSKRPAKRFRLGGRYKNRKGWLTVIALTEAEVRIRWDNGDEVTDTIESQARILLNMRRKDVDIDAGPPVPRYRPSVEICSYCGLPLTSPKYYNGQPYGSICIRHVRGW